MSDLRCPMCGKTNNSDLEFCKYCQARLKPLVIGPEAGGVSPGPGSLSAQDTDAPLHGVSDTGSDLPAWLKSLRSDAPAETSSDALPDWMADTGASGVEPAPEDEIPDWLKSLRGESNKGEEQLFDSGQTGDTASGQDASDWLAGMRDDSSEVLEEPEIGAEQAAQFGEGGQEWLQRIDSTLTPEPSSQPLENVPDKLQSQEARVPTDEPVVSPESSTPHEEADSVPEWLAGLTVASGPSEAVGKVDEPPVADEAVLSDEPQDAGIVPLAAIGGVVAAFVQDQTAGESEADNPEQLDELAGIETTARAASEAEQIPAVEVPDWLSGYDETAAPGESIVSAAGSSADSFDLDWLEEERQTLTPAAEPGLPQTGLPEADASPFEFEEEGQPFFSGELPEWLGEDVEKIGPVETAPTPGEKGEDLAHADLPSWLESMRPIESAALPAPVVEPSDKQVEGTGPLAGLRSVLPSEFELGARNAPAAYTVKLQVSDTQKTHASIIDELIKSEGQAGELPGRRTLGPQQLLLIAIFAILLLALLWPMLTGSQSVEMPYYSTEALEASNAIGNLPEVAPVLLAVDYEPGLSGEMEATASAILDHLMLKGAYLTLVSTLPTGPVQAERLVQGVNERGEHTYQSGDMYANLGYIPGGTVGIRSFAISPRQIMPFAIDGAEVWNTTALASIQKLSDFEMVLVLTENPSTARTWIEQVKPLLGDKPLLMVVSAQVEPVVRPYFEGDPQVVQGIVAGLPGGATYENMIGRFSLARKYWDAYSVGISLIALLLVVGGVIGIVLHYTAGRKPAPGVAK
jgi:hypothetical protein